MRTVFIDTSAFVALRNGSEAEHEEARATLTGLIADGASLYTSNYVFAETYTALLVRVGRREAIEWGRRFRASEAIGLVRVESGIDDDAWAILEQHRDKQWSYVDATSFALIERDGGGEAFSFDADFAQRGLRVLPGG
jgi:predicted nucleic acid-binding protein